MDRFLVQKDVGKFLRDKFHSYFFPPNSCCKVFLSSRRLSDDCLRCMCQPENKKEIMGDNECIFDEDS